MTVVGHRTEQLLRQCAHLLCMGHPKHSLSTQLKSTIIMQTCMGGWLALRNFNFRVNIFLSNFRFDIHVLKI